MSTALDNADRTLLLVLLRLRFRVVTYLPNYQDLYPGTQATYLRSPIGTAPVCPRNQASLSCPRTSKKRALLAKSRSCDIATISWRRSSLSKISNLCAPTAGRASAPDAPANGDVCWCGADMDSAPFGASPPFFAGRRI